MSVTGKPQDETISITFDGCARCGERHEDCRFRKLRNPIEDCTHWFLCPKTLEPVLWGSDLGCAYIIKSGPGYVLKLCDYPLPPMMTSNRNEAKLFSSVVVARNQAIRMVVSGLEASIEVLVLA